MIIKYMKGGFTFKNGEYIILSMERILRLGHLEREGETLSVREINNILSRKGLRIDVSNLRVKTIVANEGMINNDDGNETLIRSFYRKISENDIKLLNEGILSCRLQYFFERHFPHQELPDIATFITINPVRVNYISKVIKKLRPEFDCLPQESIINPLPDNISTNGGKRIKSNRKSRKSHKKSLRKSNKKYLKR